jgi:hypothetical protein
MAYADHTSCTVNEAELTILELGARMRQRMEEVSRIDAEFKSSPMAELMDAEMNDKFNAIRERFSAVIDKKRRDMESLQFMIDTISVDSNPTQNLVNHLESITM